MAELIKDKMEFDPREVSDLPELIHKLWAYSISRHGVGPGYKDLIIESMSNNAELHVIKFVVIK